MVDVQDGRTLEQKLQADATINRDTATANAIEKARLADEAHQRAAQTRLAAAQHQRSNSQANGPNTLSDTANAKASKRSSHKGAAKRSKLAASKPGEFVAIAPTSGAKSKKSSKRTGKGQ